MHVAPGARGLQKVVTVVPVAVTTAVVPSTPPTLVAVVVGTTVAVGTSGVCADDGVVEGPSHAQNLDMCVGVNDAHELWRKSQLRYAHWLGVSPMYSTYGPFPSDTHVVGVVRFGKNCAQTELVGLHVGSIYPEDPMSTQTRPRAAHTVPQDAPRAPWYHASPPRTTDISVVVVATDVVDTDVVVGSLVVVEDVAVVGSAVGGGVARVVVTSHASHDTGHRMRTTRSTQPGGAKTNSSQLGGSGNPLQFGAVVGMVVVTVVRTTSHGTPHVRLHRLAMAGSRHRPAIMLHSAWSGSE